MYSDWVSALTLFSLFYFRAEFIDFIGKWGWWREDWIRVWRAFQNYAKFYNFLLTTPVKLCLRQKVRDLAM